MTVKQTKYIEGLVQGKTKKQSALDAGYAESTANTACQNIESDFLRSKIDIAFEQKGLSLGDFIDKLKAGLEADMEAPSWHRFKDKCEWIPDHNTRLKYLIISLKLWRLI